MGGVAAQCVALTRSVPGGCSLPAWVQQTKGAPTLSVLNAGADHEASRSQGAIGAATPASVQSWQWLSWQCGWRCGWWCGQRHGQCTGGSGWAWHAWQRTPGRAGAACRRRRRAASGEHDGAPWTSTWRVHRKASSAAVYGRVPSFHPFLFLARACIFGETLVRTTYAAWVGMVAGARARPLAARGVGELVTLHATAVVESSAWHRRPCQPTMSRRAQPTDGMLPIPCVVAVAGHW